MNLKRKIEALASEMAFFLRNFSTVLRFERFKQTTINGILYRGFQGGDSQPVATIYAELNKGAKLGLFRKTLYTLVGERILLLAIENHQTKPKIVAMNLFYLNHRDKAENTIHEGFVGVMSEAAGQGIATQMRKISKAHFASLGIKGISTRISRHNSASLRSAQKIGFEPVELYCDPQTHEERYYMVCKLEEK